MDGRTKAAFSNLSGLVQTLPNFRMDQTCTCSLLSRELQGVTESKNRNLFYLRISAIISVDLGHFTRVSSV